METWNATIGVFAMYTAAFTLFIMVLPTMARFGARFGKLAIIMGLIRCFGQQDPTWSIQVAVMIGTGIGLIVFNRVVEWGQGFARSNLHAVVPMAVIRQRK